MALPGFLTGVVGLGAASELTSKQQQLQPDLGGKLPVVGRGSPLKRCDQGPYVWDRTKNYEGIGPQLMTHKPSLIYAHAQNAIWIDDETPNVTSYNAFLGLGYKAPVLRLKEPVCDSDSLRQHKAAGSLQFVQASWFKFGRDTLSELCSKREISSGEEEEEDEDSLIALPKNKTAIAVQNKSKLVLVFDDDDEGKLVNDKEANRGADHLEEFNYCLFDSRFRENYHDLRETRLSGATSLTRDAPEMASLRPSGQMWVVIHYKPGGVSLEQLARLGSAVVESGVMGSRDSLTVHLFAEGERDAYHNFAEYYFPSTKTVIHPISERTAEWHIDMMTQAQVLLGGSGGFFATAAHLCTACVVFTHATVREGSGGHGLPYSMGGKFKPTVDGMVPPHHHLLDVDSTLNVSAFRHAYAAVLNATLASQA